MDIERDLKMAKQRCIRINKNNTITEKQFTIEDGNILDGDTKIKFTPQCVFPPAKVEKRFYQKILFWRWFKHAESCIFFVAGALKALTWAEMLAGLQTYWNQKESKLFVKKMIALESMRFKHMTNFQFAIILLVNIAGIGILYWRLTTMMG